FIGTIVINNTSKLHFTFFGLYQFTLVGNYANGPTINTCVSRDNGLSITRFVFLKFRIINQAFNDFIHIVLFHSGFRQYAINITWVFLGLGGFNSTKTSLFVITNLINNIFNGIQGIGIILGFVICNTRYFTMGSGTTKGFIVYSFTNSGLH